MRGHALLGGLAALALAAWTSPRSERTREISRAGGRSGVAAPLFQFLPASGAGAPVAMDLCDAVTTDDKVGNWWCLKGDGTMATGSAVTLSAVGAPTTQTRPLCSNGLACADATAQRTDGVDDAYASGNVASNAGGDVSVCWLGMHDSMANYRSMVSHADNTADDNAYSFYTDATGAATAVVYKTNASSTSVTTAASAITARARHLVCFTYDYVADGTSVLRTYVDGAESGTASTTAVGPMQTASGTTEAVAYRPWSGSNLWLAGATFGAFKTEKVLSAADMTRLSAAVHGTLTGSRGEAVAFTRTSAQTCDNGSGSVTVLPSGRPCVAQSGYLSETSATNLLLRSEEVDVAPWSTARSSGVLTLTSNAATAPDGTKTADQADYPTVSGGASYALIKQDVTLTAAAHSFSVWVRSDSGSNTLWLLAYDAATGNDPHAVQITATPTWQRFTLTFTPASATAYTFGIGSARIWLAGGNLSAQTDYVWGAQIEASASASSYIRTEGSTATRNATKLTGTKPTSLGDTQGCMAGTVKVPAVTAGARVLDWNAGYSYLQSTTDGRSYDSTNTVTAAAGSSVVDRYVRLATVWQGSSLTTKHDGVEASGSYDGALTGASFFIGSTTTPDNHLNGFIKQVEIDSSLTRCDQ